MVSSDDISKAYTVRTVSTDNFVESVDLEFSDDASTELDASNEVVGNGKPTGNGSAFFGYFTLPFIMFGAIQYSFHTLVFIKYHTWSMLSLVFLLNNDEIVTPKQDSNKANVLLSFHGLVSIVVVGLTIYQVLSGLYSLLSNKSKQTLRLTHRRLGYPLALLWIISAVSGTIYMFSSPRLAKEWEEKGGAFMAYFIFALNYPGLMIFINLFNGIRAVMRKTKEERDMVLHTGSMFFVVFWIGFVWAPQLILQFLQVTFLRDCYAMEGPQFKLAYTLITTMEWLVLIILGRRRGGDAFRRKFVTYNLYAMAVELAVFWAGLFFVFATEPWDDHEHACLKNVFQK